MIHKFQQPAWSEFIFQDRSITKQNIFVEASKYYVLSWLPTVVCLLVAFTISVLTRSSVSIIRLFLALSGNIALLAADVDITGRNIDCQQTQIYIAFQRPESFIDGVTFPFASCMLLLDLFVILMHSIYSVFKT